MIETVGAPNESKTTGKPSAVEITDARDYSGECKDWHAIEYVLPISECTTQ